jgi:hypothetical protein
MGVLARPGLRATTTGRKDLVNDFAVASPRMPLAGEIAP